MSHTVHHEVVISWDSLEEETDDRRGRTTDEALVETWHWIAVERINSPTLTVTARSRRVG